MYDIFKPGLVLFTITLVVSIVLGAVNSITSELIENSNKAAKSAAMAKILPGVYHNNFSDDIKITDENSSVVYYNIGYDENDEVVGYVFETSVKGYAGYMAVYVGICTEGSITGISLGPNSETPGLGKNAEKENFTNQFIGKDGSLSVVKSAPKNDNEIQAVTASTITSRAVTNGVNDAYKSFLSIFQNTGGVFQ